MPGTAFFLPSLTTFASAFCFLFLRVFLGLLSPMGCQLSAEAQVKARLMRERVGGGSQPDRRKVVRASHRSLTLGWSPTFDLAPSLDCS